MDISEFFGSSRSVDLHVTEFKDLLNTYNIESIYIHANKKVFGNGFTFSANIKFSKNGSTFEKRIEATSLEDAYRKAYNFCSTL